MLILNKSSNSFLKYRVKWKVLANLYAPFYVLSMKSI